MSSLTLGEIEFLNCLPLFALLKDYFPAADYRYIQGNPAQLNHLLATGAIDISPSSSMEYALRPHNYFILPHIAISSKREVRSVLLVSKKPIEDLAGSTIALTAQSLTSIYLLKIILSHFYRLDPEQLTYSMAEFSPADHAPEAALLIGDQALRLYHRQPPGYLIYDLGSLWYQFTGLPFVYALWIGRNHGDDERQKKIIQLHQQLCRIKNSLPDHGTDLLALASRRYPELPHSAIQAYWHKAISYDFGPEEQQGLVHFYQLTHQQGFLPATPPLNFFPNLTNPSRQSFPDTNI
ncbi:MAG: menaquinone biosynthesis protein [Deltaproteobacteria bacterium]|nr:menaquinone biosynthesis protein [Candidatus Anaeroferrophillus wilburensis]MBN2889674.1 menaquinone biosynthesis protein [Deltaproteobacteria bacterium]